MRRFYFEIALGTTSDNTKTGREISPKATAVVTIIVFIICVTVLKSAGVI